MRSRSSSLGYGHRQLEQEPVELGLGQRVGALHLDRVLGGQHEERLGQRVGGAAGGDAALLHRFEQRGLRLGRGAVDLVGEHQVGEERPGLELERARAVGGVAQDAGAGDVGRHQVGRELDAAERQIERLAEGAHQQRLAQAGDAFQQRVAAGEQAGQDAAHDFGLADDDAGRPRPRSLARSR